MLRLASYDIVFQEIPGEVSLALNIAGCPNRCPGCHSPHLQRDEGGELDERLLESLLDSYASSVTCVCFMGGDNEPSSVEALCSAVRGRGLKTAWYSGRESLPAGFDPARLDYVKLGPYVERLGGLDRPTTNQRLYKVDGGGAMTDITARMRKQVAEFGDY